MSEALKHSPEQGNFEALSEVKTAERPKAGEYSKAEQELNLQHAKAIVEVAAGTSEGVQLPQIVDDRPQLIDNSIKALRMRQSLAKVQTKLRPAERSFSKVVHQPLVQKVSESAAKTVARPSGILGGGLTAFVGCLGYQTLTRYYGLPYNFSFFILFFVGGFALGLMAEYLIQQARKISR